MLMVATAAHNATARAQPTTRQAVPKPNVVLIMMDDMGYGDLASYGATDVRTPNSDRLAREGVRLTDAYANGQVCSPTRAALISGRYPQRFGIERALTNALADSAIGLPVTGTSLPALLKHNGYATGLVGKWHLGFRRDFSPLAHGFDEFFGFLAGAHDYYIGDVYHDTTRVPLNRYLTDEITDPDDGVGKILAALEKRGLSRNTLIIFTNDNGGERLSRNAPLSNRKGSLWEGGIRVPLILRWPAVLPAGKTFGQVALTMDLTASILAATGTKPPSTYRPDGMDILPVLRGQASVVERHVFWRVRRPVRPMAAVRSGRWKLLVEGDSAQLFDLVADPGEKTDRAPEFPDRVSALRRLLAEWENDVDRKAAGGR